MERGEYFLFGADEKRVRKLESAYSSAVLFPSEFLKQQDSIDVFPKCTIVKNISSFCGRIKLLEKILEDELVISLFKKYDLSLPSTLSRKDFKTLYIAYQRSLETEALEEENELQQLLEIVSSWKNIEEYEQEHSKRDVWLSKLFPKKEVQYTPVSANCVSKEQMLELPYDKGKMDVSHGENGAIVRRIDEELGKYPDIKWSLKETATITSCGANGNQYCHRLVYPMKHEATVASIVNKIELGLDIFATAIPRKLFHRFTTLVEEIGLEYYFDETSVYIPQNQMRLVYVWRGRLRK